MHLKPLNDNIIIEQDPMDYVDDNPEVARIVKEGTIVLPEKNSILKSSNIGTVISWGSRCHYKYFIGQRIMFGRFGGANIIHEGKKYRVIKEWEIIATYEPE